MSLISKSDATHVSRNGITGNIARYYYLQQDGYMFRWSVKDHCWVGTNVPLRGLEEIKQP